MKTEMILAGYYKVFSKEYFANIKLERYGEFKGKWFAEIRYNNGSLKQYAGIWNSKREAVNEVAAILERY